MSKQRPTTTTNNPSFVKTINRRTILSFPKFTLLYLVPLFFLIVGLILSFIVWQQQDEAYLSRERLRLSRDIDQARSAVVNRMNTYAESLEGLSTFFSLVPHFESQSQSSSPDALTNQFHRSDWKTYLAKLDLTNRYPGINTTTYAAIVKADELASFETTVRNDGVPNYHIKAAFSTPISATSASQIYYPIQFTEPELNGGAALGLDLNTDPVRKLAVERSRDTGQPSLSGRLILASNSHPGFILILPVYHNGLSLNTLEQRRTAVQGWVLHTFSAQELLAAALKDNLSNELKLEIYDGKANDSTTWGERNLLYNSDQELDAPTGRADSQFKQAIEVEIDAHSWTFFFNSSAQFDTSFAAGRPIMMLVGGIIFSLLIFVALFVAVTSRLRLIGTLGVVKRQANQLTETVSALETQRAASKAVSQEVVTLAEQLNFTASQQADGSQDQFAAVSQVAGSMEELTETANQIADFTSQVATFTNQAVELANGVREETQLSQLSANQGQVAVRHTITSVHSVSERLKILMEQLSQLSVQSQKANNIIKLIDEIADETHLLALNASIEAAGGEYYSDETVSLVPVAVGSEEKGINSNLLTSSNNATSPSKQTYSQIQLHSSTQLHSHMRAIQGARFGVIAQEVQSLSTRTRRATEEVRQIITEINQSITAAVLMAEQGQTESVLSLKHSQTAGEVIEKLAEVVNEGAERTNIIITTIKEITHKSNEIRIATQQQHTANQQILTIMHTITLVASDTTTSANQLSYTAQALNEQALALII